MAPARPLVIVFLFVGAALALDGAGAGAALLPAPARRRVSASDWLASDRLPAPARLGALPA